MDQNELRQIINKYEDKDWLTGNTFVINYLGNKDSVSLKGLLAFNKYINLQKEGWDKTEPKVLSDIDNSKTYFNQLYGDYVKFLISLSSGTLQNIQSTFQNVSNRLNLFKNHVLPSDGEIIQFVSSLNSTIRPGAYRYLIDQNPGNTKYDFEGMIKAYEFENKDSSMISILRKNEKSNFSTLKVKFESYISEMEETIRSIQKQCDLYKNEMQSDNIATKSEFENKYNEWFSKTETEFECFDEESKSKIEHLEDVYDKKLKIAKPAEYWNQRAEDMERNGSYHKITMIVLIAVVICLLYPLLIIVPDGMILSLAENPAAAIKWSLVLLTIISVLIFGIRANYKLMFSYFHLASDAKEREQLTYFYLALSKDTEISSDERNLIMQSLFSRADTGMLKEDSSPTMPNDFVGKVLGK